jgi:hypothetical protein
VLAAAVLALAGTAAAPAWPAAPVVDQLVVFRSGDAKQASVRAGRTSVKVGGRRCGVPRATPLAVLARSRVAELRMRDYSRSCDPSSLFVAAIGADRNRGARGWVYKVGHRQGTAGAADPSGPFGAGRLRAGSRITWFYCVFRAGGCQRTLGLKASPQGGGRVSVHVRAYDDEGRGAPAAGALVHAGAVSAETDERGRATLVLPPGPRTLHAEKDGQIRSFGEVVAVR